VTDFTVKEAAQRFGVGVNTVRRRLQGPVGDDGRRDSDSLPNAYLIDGSWRIPEGDLKAATWTKRERVEVDAMMSRPPEFLEDDDLHAALHEAETRAEFAEALLDEVRERLAVLEKLVESKNETKAEYERHVQALLAQIEFQAELLRNSLPPSSTPRET
jgi:hypothetical protein